jgi:hypothetical protein
VSPARCFRLCEKMEDTDIAVSPRDRMVATEASETELQRADQPRPVFLAGMHRTLLR